MIRSFGAAQLTVRVLLILFVVLSCRQAAAAEPASVDAGALYHDYCSVCHGDSGDGNSHARQGLKPPPRDFTDPEVAASMTREYMIQVVTHGKPGTAMTAWNSRLNDDEIALIVDYIHDHFMPREYQEVNSRGAEIYQATCSVCHGDDGQGAYWAGSGLKPPPRNFTTDEARSQMTRERMRTSILAGRPGTAMTPFASQLTTEDVEAVIDYIQQTFMGLPSTE